MSATVILCGKIFASICDRLTGPAEIRIENGLITEIAPAVRRPSGAQVTDLRGRTVSPGFIDTHVHLTMDAGNLPMQTLESSAAKALKGLSIAREYMRYGFTTLRDLGSADPDFPTVDLRNALAAGIVEGPRLIVAAHIISASGGHGDLRGFYGSRWTLPVSAIADDPGSIKALVRREHTFGSDWIKTTNTGGYFSPGDDPARLTWFDEEMDVLVATARQLGMPVAVHTGAAAGCRQAIRAGARSLEHAYLIDAEAIAMAEKAGTWVVPTRYAPGRGSNPGSAASRASAAAARPSRRPGRSPSHSASAAWRCADRARINPRTTRTCAFFFCAWPPPKGPIMTAGSAAGETHYRRDVVAPGPRREEDDLKSAGPKKTDQQNLDVHTARSTRRSDRR